MNAMPKALTQAGCFRIGSNVFRGNGKKILTITAINAGIKGVPYAKLNKGVWYPITELSLAGPNGDGKGA